MNRLCSLFAQMHIQPEGKTVGIAEGPDDIQLAQEAEMLGAIPRRVSGEEDLAGISFLIDPSVSSFRSDLRFAAKMQGIPSIGGLDLQNGRDREELYAERNIVLTGMSTAGKTTLSALAAQRSGRTLIEMDDVITERMGMSIPVCFREKGEAYFRRYERELAEDLCTVRHAVISCGGGVVKDEETMRFLSRNGIVCWLDRSPDKLFPSDSRPLAATAEAVMKLYRERRHLYQKYADVRIDNNGTLEEAVTTILKAAQEQMI